MKFASTVTKIWIRVLYIYTLPIITNHWLIIFVHEWFPVTCKRKPQRQNSYQIFLKRTYYVETYNSYQLNYYTKYILHKTVALGEL